MNNELSNIAISELICTRLSHDIIGNVGAVSNAVELLEEGDMDFLDDIRSILKNSSSVLSARLKFFRLVFGLNNTNLDNFELVYQTTQDYLSTLGNISYPIALKFNLKNSAFCKIAMLGVMSLADTLIRGGAIEVNEKTDALEIVSFTTASRSKEKVDAIQSIVAGQNFELSAQYAPIFYLKELLSQSKINIYIINSDSFGFIIK